MRLSPPSTDPLTTARLSVAPGCAGEELAGAVEQALEAAGFSSLGRQARELISPLSDRQQAQSVARRYLRLSVPAPRALQDAGGPPMRMLPARSVVLRSALTGGSRLTRTAPLAAGEALVSRELFSLFAAEAGGSTAERAALPVSPVGGDQPCAGITLPEAQLFCLWLSQRCGRTYRLPFEWEWVRLLAEGESVFDGLHGPLWQWTQSTWHFDVCRQTPLERHAIATLVGGGAEEMVWGSEESHQPPYRRCEGAFSSEPNVWIGLRVFAELTAAEIAILEADDA